MTDPARPVKPSRMSHHRNRSPRLIAALLATCMLTSPPATAQTASSTQRDPSAALAPKARDGRPNVLILMLDDVGFGQIGAFGGLVDTPNIDRVAARGVRYTNYHGTPICSATRAAFLTGRNSHTVHMGGHPIFASENPGYDGVIPPGAGTLAENLRQGGYATFALGKWDHLPTRETGPSGPQARWPLGQGFERYYGFLASETDNFHPLLVRDNTPVAAPHNPDYILNKDLADSAIDMVRSRDGQPERRPFLMYLAPGTAHAPHHASQSWIDRYRGRFDEGWDKARARILRRQIAQGIVPRGTKVAARPDRMQAWDSLSADEKKLFAHQMEVFAAALSEADEQFGRVLDELQARGELENTVVLITSDNGASAEGSVAGSYQELFFARGAQPSAAENMKYYDRWGGPETYPHYSFGWAVAGNTPFRYYKQTTYEGGLRVPLIVAMPGVAGKGRVDTSFVHVSDVTPTMLELATVDQADAVNNTPQMPFDGTSFAATLRDPHTVAAHKDQYFEVFGHRAFWSDGWKIVSPSRLNVWDIMSPAKLNEPWQLFNVGEDPGETVDLAGTKPEIVERLKQGFEKQARQFNVFPITGQFESFGVQARLDAQDFARRNGKWLYPGPISRIPKMMAPPIDRRSFNAAADIELASARETGPIFALGGGQGGMSFYLKEGQPRFALRGLDGSFEEVEADGLVPGGKSKLALQVDHAGNRHTVSISLDGRLLVRREIMFSISPVVPETFDVGRDDGTAVSSDYAANTPFPGTLTSLSFKVR
jgi:arylsulfatase A-like enzyme